MNLTTAGDRTFWFMLEPLAISTAVFDALTPEQQKIFVEVGASLEPFGIEEAKKDDQRAAEIFQKAGAQVHDMNDQQFKQWREVEGERFQRLCGPGQERPGIVGHGLGRRAGAALIQDARSAGESGGGDLSVRKTIQHPDGFSVGRPDLHRRVRAGVRGRSLQAAVAVGR